MLPSLRVGGDNSHEFALLVDAFLVIILPLQIFEMVQHTIFPTNFAGQVDLHERSSFEIVHGGVKSRPDLKALDGDGFLGIEAIAAQLLELHHPHHALEENGVEGEHLGVGVVDDLRIFQSQLVFLIV